MASVLWSTRTGSTCECPGNPWQQCQCNSDHPSDSTALSLMPANGHLSSLPSSIAVFVANVSPLPSCTTLARPISPYCNIILLTFCRYGGRSNSADPQEQCNSHLYGYDPTTNTWDMVIPTDQGEDSVGYDSRGVSRRSLNTASRPRRWHTAVVHEDCMYVFGGQVGMADLICAAHAVGMSNDGTPPGVRARRQELIC